MGPHIIDVVHHLTAQLPMISGADGRTTQTPRFGFDVRLTVLERPVAAG
ncbi:hypothetical protein HMPREF0591_5625 [Mycobacterium parascrofulaceum ATCC BAA-614]|uniref:Uncharacterized protein n=1 Tax=Mycobacterium parascrofulaceum ATCC BAA-614 TaxID=525368 RepID=D5PHI1_9MYCO|nr:hypothetical protein HMPREF0591_5625 [Mycobacterium parascrofulaceum ATCC BAA-614]